MFICIMFLFAVPGFNLGVTTNHRMCIRPLPDDRQLAINWAVLAGRWTVSHPEAVNIIRVIEALRSAVLDIVTWFSGGGEWSGCCVTTIVHNVFISGGSVDIKAAILVNSFFWNRRRRYSLGSTDRSVAVIMTVMILVAVIVSVAVTISWSVIVLL